MRRAKILAMVAAAVAVVIVVQVAVRRQHHAGPRPQAESGLSFAPDFTLKRLDGTPLRLSDYRGKVVLLDFWATWCTPCREEIPRFVEWQRKYGAQGLQVIGISMDDDSEAVKKFVRDFGVNYPVAIGDQELASRYGGILGLPANIVIGRDGKMVSKHLGMADLSMLERELAVQLASSEKTQ